VAEAARTGLSRPAVVALVAVALAAYVGILFVRQGPPATGDTPPLTSVATLLSQGDLRGAASVVSLPNPPGYALLASPFVAALRPLIGSATWCTTSPRVRAMEDGIPAADRADLAQEEGQCGVRVLRADGRLGAALPPWYRAQGVLAVLAWLVLVGGCLALLRATGAATAASEAALVVFLVILPSASSAVVQLFHPQDLVSLGLSAAALSRLLRGRWISAGLLFGLAFLTKQFAALVFLPAVFAAPDWPTRRRLVAAAGAVVAAGLLPFLAVAPRITLQNVSGIGAAGAVSGATLLSLLHAPSTLTSAVARDAPVAFALVASLWARRRLGSRLIATAPLLGLVLACLASRLVFESVIFPYYLLAASVAFFLLDLSLARLPDRSLAWIAATAAFVVIHPTNTTVDAMGTLVLAVAAVVAGMVQVSTFRRHPRPEPGAELERGSPGAPGDRIVSPTGTT
jgi:hypothetical protein